MLNILKKSSEVIRKFIKSLPVFDWAIETPDGFQDIQYIHKTIKYEVWKLKTDSGKILKCADTHIVFDENFEEVFVKDLIPNVSKIITKDGIETITSLKNTGKGKHMYDVSINSQDETYYSNDILSHNSTASLGYILHYIIFNSNIRVALLANKGSTARTELLGRLQQSFENLPIWLQQGIVSWNKGSLELENGSRVIAGATSSSAVRGGSFNCISGNSIITVEKPDGVILNLKILDLFNDSASLPINNIGMNFIDNKYTQTYHRIIDNAKIRNWAKKSAPCYTENHHIIPKCFSRDNSTQNLVRLTAREHFIVHKLLTKMFEGPKEKSKMISALFLMIHNLKKSCFTNMYSVSSKEYNALKEEYKLAVKISLTGIKRSQKTKDKISKTKTGKKLPFKKKTLEHINKINKNPLKIAKMAESHRGMKRSDESKKKMSLAKQGYIPWNKGVKGSMSLGKKWCTNISTKETKMVDPANIPEGYILGRPFNKRGKNVK